MTPAASRLLRRAATISTGVVVAATATLGIEAFIASRVERLDPHDPALIGGRIGDGGDPLRIAWLGDSTGDGVGASSPAAALPRQVAASLNRAIDLQVLATSGATAADVLREQVPRLAAARAEWVVVCVGGNDVTHLTSATAFRSSLDRILDAARATNPQRIVVVGIGEFAATPLLAQPLRAIAGRRADRLDREVRAAARSAGAVYVDIIQATGPSFVADPAGLHARDGFHPNDRGYRLWSDAIVGAIRRADGNNDEGA